MALVMALVTLALVALELALVAGLGHLLVALELALVALAWST